ncbi:MAG: hypothetical protein IT355_12095 [Gemmatimonadaceae bacterium]|nr:hypothetical protein [Gemmatimonadaceae bacterium]
MGDACIAEVLHTDALYAWCDAAPEHQAAFARARQRQADSFAERGMRAAFASNADVVIDAKGQPRVRGEVVMRSRLQWDACRWYAAILSPHYADKVDHTGEVRTRLLVDVERLSGSA